jgi:hypothetical protein
VGAGTRSGSWREAEMDGGPGGMRSRVGWREALGLLGAEDNRVRGERGVEEDERARAIAVVPLLWDLGDRSSGAD